MSSVHDKHRQRVRKEFLARGFDESTPEHKILEMLLFYSIPRKDTNELAHNLIDRFGSLSNLLEAETKTLMEVDGVGENTAALIKLILPIAKVYQNQKKNRNSSFGSMDEIGEYLTRKYIGFTKEMFSVMCFDNMGKMCGFDFLSSGDISSVGVTSRMVLEKVLNHNATNAIICHNHPGGSAMPSSEDLELTGQIAAALKSISVRLVDHIIICGNDYVSFRQSTQYKHMLT